MSAYVIFNLHINNLEMASISHLTPNLSVAGLLKMLTYAYVCCAFSSVRALTFGVTWDYETISNLYPHAKTRSNKQLKEFSIDRTTVEFM
jgi:hypothetical protein